MFVLEQAIKREQFGEEKEKALIYYIKEWLSPKYADFIGNEIQKAYLESYSDYGQNLFDRYIQYADHWIQEIDFKDPLIKEMLSAPNDVGVYVEQWLPVHNHSRIGKSKKTGYGVYANAPFEFETEYGICIKS